MLTIEKIVNFMEPKIAEDFLAGDRVGIRNSQIAGGVLMAAAKDAGDSDLHEPGALF